MQITGYVAHDDSKTGQLIIHVRLEDGRTFSIDIADCPSKPLDKTTKWLRVNSVLMVPDGI